jgi:hypothetical protein
MALEELPAIAYGISRDGRVSVNLFGPSAAVLNVPGAGEVRLEQTTTYPFDGEVAIRVTPSRPASFAIHVRIPAWAEGASVLVNGVSVASSPSIGAYAQIERTWRENDVIALSFPMRPRPHRRTNRNVQESQAPDGSYVSQEVLHFDYLAITRGPLVYATGLIDGYKTEETLRVDIAPSDAWLEAVPTTNGHGPDVRLRPVGRPPLIFSPYYRAGGRRDHSWRLTWMQLAPE